MSDTRPEERTCNEDISRQSVSRARRKNRGCREMLGHQFLKGENGSGQRSWSFVRLRFVQRRETAGIPKCQQRRV